MAKINLPPKRNQVDGQVSPEVVDEKKIQEIINKGGSTTKQAAPEPLEDEDKLKQTTVSLTGKELNRILAVREKRGKSRTGRKLKVSLHDWIVEAVLEKLEKEEKQYKIS
jgi:hypothetical protein